MSMMNESAKRDLLRYKKNSGAALLTYLAIVFDALYFISVYSSDFGSTSNADKTVVLYQWLIGISIVYNLLFLLAAFLSSEGVKNYKIGFSFLLILMGIGQLVRIFVIPAIARFGTVEQMFERGIFNEITDEHIAYVLEQTGRTIPIIEQGQFIYMCICLMASAAFCIIAGVLAFIKSTTLKSYMAELKKRGSKT
ncbi:MAG: hypothetical protein J1F04_06860 [Oscillospiraceae bacterium]|nr:hypothetical protein [Oscillospiraceae bacterium]